MKYILIILPALLLYCSRVKGQSCTGGPQINCSGEKVISPTMLQPTGVGFPPLLVFFTNNPK